MPVDQDKVAKSVRKIITQLDSLSVEERLKVLDTLNSLYGSGS